jgi:hypothetical protein
LKETAFFIATVELGARDRMVFISADFGSSSEDSEGEERRLIFILK